MDTIGLNLLIPDKADPERDALAREFINQGGEVHRIGRFWDPPNFESASVRVYGPDSFCLVLQLKLGFSLLSPAEDLLLRLPHEFLQRQVTHQTLGEASSFSYPVFIKPLMPKQFRGAVYSNFDVLMAECRGLAATTAIMMSDTVTFICEVRCFILDGRVLDAATYEGDGNASEALTFVAALLQNVSLPRAFVLDVGLIADRGWAVIEFNAAWGAGLNGCSAELVLPAIVAATE